MRDSSMLIPITQTCRRLREVALSHPALWTTFEAVDERVPLIRLLAKWSQHLPLNVDIAGLAVAQAVMDKIPEGDEMFADMDDEKQLAAAIFRHNPDHRWWYFSGMGRDEALLLKFHDSDRSVGWRTPHTAFWDESFPDANVRESIECRSIAFFE